MQIEDRARDLAVPARDRIVVDEAFRAGGEDLKVVVPGQVGRERGEDRHDGSVDIRVWKAAVFEGELAGRADVLDRVKEAAEVVPVVPEFGRAGKASAVERVINREGKLCRTLESDGQ